MANQTVIVSLILSLHTRDVQKCWLGWGVFNSRKMVETPVLWSLSESGYSQKKPVRILKFVLVPLHPLSRNSDVTAQFASESGRCFRRCRQGEWCVTTGWDMKAAKTDSNRFSSEPTFRMTRIWARGTETRWKTVLNLCHLSLPV
jgi:hypothetical protein